MPFHDNAPCSKADQLHFHCRKKKKHISTKWFLCMNGKHFLYTVMSFCRVNEYRGWVYRITYNCHNGRGLGVTCLRPNIALLYTWWTNEILRKLKGDIYGRDKSYITPFPFMVSDPFSEESLGTWDWRFVSGIVNQSRGRRPQKTFTGSYNGP